jgi:hypothetical protein
MKRAACLLLAAALAGGFCAGCSSVTKVSARPKMAALAIDTDGNPLLFPTPGKAKTPAVKTPAESPAPGGGNN